MTTIVFVWDNFGPTHDDRLRAVENAYGGLARVVGIELFGKSDTYAWDNDHNTDFEKVTLFQGTGSRRSTMEVASAIVRSCQSVRAEHIFMCNYDQKYIFLAAFALRLLGRKVYALADSKFDDYKRYLWREVAKSVFYSPYIGGLSNEVRSADYMRFLGVDEKKIAAPYNTVSLHRVRNLAGCVPAPGGTPFDDRHFTIIARFVPKKNLPVALEAYALYCRQTDRPRTLHLCGSGELEPLLRSRVEALGLEGKVVFAGFLQSGDIAVTLGRSLALILPSIEEQFGIVVIEAQAMGLPVIVSDNCGARDVHVRSGVNGFVIEPDNPEGLAFFMRMIDRDEALWRRMCLAAGTFAEKGDVARFAEAVQMLVAAA